MDKRARKLELIEKENNSPAIYGKGKRAVLVWGSQLLPALEMQKMLKQKGEEIAVIHFNWLYPLFKNKILPKLKEFEEIIAFENNSTALFSRLLRMETSFFPHKVVLKYNGRQFFAEQMIRALEEIEKDKEKTFFVVRKENESFEYYKPWLYV